MLMLGYSFEQISARARLQTYAPRRRVFDAPAFTSFTNPATDSYDKGTGISARHADRYVVVMQLKDVDRYSSAMQSKELRESSAKV